MTKGPATTKSRHCMSCGYTFQIPKNLVGAQLCPRCRAITR